MAAKRFLFWRLDTVFLIKKEKNGGEIRSPFGNRRDGHAVPSGE